MHASASASASASALPTCSDVTCDCCAVAMDNGEVHIYNGSACVSSFSTPDIITGMRFGTYSREPFSLVLASRSGALTFKMAKRTASFKATDVPSGPPPEQDIPIPVPKKTKLYLDQMQRERDQAREMHRIFQRDLCRLRLATARAYVKVCGRRHRAHVHACLNETRARWLI
ncbi:hypothetical protein EON67_04375 [archaeon]|nr:MAG: hypothetical protein EON67_04375 [archaeon]